jgi:hypothetical protein
MLYIFHICKILSIARQITVRISWNVEACTQHSNDDDDDDDDDAVSQMKHRNYYRNNTT